eukprot:CAMPEP_0204429254 /NCGR_PEP_ID=MMETSP0470-20130426/59811_1 /ASSEMBLY_ACC=CAM_ASM_000385 /TAXON_ID=2969 /ORGANISM="Oxyrrhis marina" /LENGTH=41 /DNA_ID= /DNA_START= /DNA_END= /DNA_ORIENTATION=
MRVHTIDLHFVSESDHLVKQRPKHRIALRVASHKPGDAEHA